MHLLLGTINTCSDLFVNCIEIAEIFQAKFVSYSITGHLTCKKQSPSLKNTRDMHIHKSLSNVTIHTHYINIHHTGHYQSEMGFVHALTHCMELTAFSCSAAK